MKKKFIFQRRWKAFITFIFSRNLRKKSLHKLVSYLYTTTKMHDSPIPSKSIKEIAPRCSFCYIDYPDFSNGNMSIYELYVLSALIKTCNPRHLLEIGTFNGLTTLHMAMNSVSEAKIHTLDLPHECLQDNFSEEDLVFIRSSKRILKKYTTTPYMHKIIEHLGNSLEYPFENFLQNTSFLEFILIDGGHHHAVVENDSQKTLSLLKNGGMIVWHDYTPDCLGVFNFLNHLGKRLPLIHIENTTLVMYQKSQ